MIWNIFIYLVDKININKTLLNHKFENLIMLKYRNIILDNKEILFDIYLDFS